MTHQAGVWSDTCLRQGLLASEQALETGEIDGRPGQKGDALMAESKQVLGRLASAIYVIRFDIGSMTPLTHPIDEHGGKGGKDQGLHVCNRCMEHNDPGDTPCL